MHSGGMEREVVFICAHCARKFLREWLLFYCASAPRKLLGVFLRYSNGEYARARTWLGITLRRVAQRRENGRSTETVMTAIGCVDVNDRVPRTC